VPILHLGQEVDFSFHPAHLSKSTSYVSTSRLRKNATKLRKSFLQGPFVPQDKLKPIESTEFTSALKHRPPEELKHRPPEEKDFFGNLLGCKSEQFMRLKRDSSLRKPTHSQEANGQEKIGLLRSE
jgi:hypothetical protein